MIKVVAKRDIPLSESAVPMNEYRKRIMSKKYDCVVFYVDSSAHGSEYIDEKVLNFTVLNIEYSDNNELLLSIRVNGSKNACSALCSMYGRGLVEFKVGFGQNADGYYIGGVCAHVIAGNSKHHLEFLTHTGLLDKFGYSGVDDVTLIMCE